MNIEPSSTVSEVAIEIPGAIDLFERMRIDYSCRGGRSLAEACDLAGVDANEIIEELARLRAAMPEEALVNWFEKSLTDVISYIVETHHHIEEEEIRKLGDEIVRLRDEEQDSPDLKRIHALFTTLTDNLARHMLHEERELFGRIARMERAAHDSGNEGSWRISVRNLVLTEFVEHDLMVERLRNMRELTSSFTPPPDASAGVVALYAKLHELDCELNRHMHLENNVLFPRALEMENQLKQARYDSVAG
ncbi:MAG TPA: DUF542 domain-containing protein [Thermoanaerobaculia bacterium]|nr:DUF542 domain-containing protein [Thermoanaerobaculia bacterium]